MSTVAVVGATGGVGAHVTRLAAEAGHGVRALARRPERIESQANVTPVACDVRDIDSVRAALRGVDVVLSCLGNDRGRAQVTHEGTVNLLEAAKDAHRLVAISSLGVGDSLAQSRRLSWIYGYLVVPTVLRRPLKDLGRMEEAMRAHALPTVILRPVGLTNGALTGRGTGVDVSERVGLMVSRADVAAVMVSLIDDDRWDNQAKTVGLPV